MKGLFNEYVMRARIFPALIVISPVILNMYLLIAEMREITTTLMTVVVGLGWIELIAMIARIKGKEKSKKVYSGSNISPAARFLRLTDDTVNINSKNRYHKFLAKHVDGYKVYTLEEEKKNQQQADLNYKSGVEWLRNNRRDPIKHKFILEENIHSGFCRNLYGLKSTAIITLVTVIAILAIKWISEYGLVITGVSTELYTAVIIDLALLIIWIREVNPKIMKQANESYARKLLESCDQIENNKE